MNRQSNDNDDDDGEFGIRDLYAKYSNISLDFEKIKNN